MCNCDTATDVTFDRDVNWGPFRAPPVQAQEWANALLGVRWDGHIHTVWVDDKDHPTKVNMVGRAPNAYSEVTPEWEVLRVISERT